MKSMITLVVVLAVCPIAQATVLTGPTVNPANGHTYYLLEQDTWTNSEAEAVTLGGHLATINDAAENQWVFDFATSNVSAFRFWIGLNDADLDGDFVWSSGEPVTYTNWRNGQPSGDPENYAHIYGSGSLSELWNDIIDVPDAYGVVEVVPEPGTAGLLGAAGLLALLRRRRGGIRREWQIR